MIRELRTVSVRVEVQVSVEDDELAEVQADLADRARRAVEDSPRHRQTYHAATVLRRR